MPKLRIEGTPEEVEALAALLRETVDVLEESRNYPNRPPSKFVRRYVTVGATRAQHFVAAAQELTTNQQSNQ